MTNIKVTNITTEDILASAENDLTQAVYDYMKLPGTRKELRPVLQEMASKEEALEVIQAYVTNTLPFSKQITKDFNCCATMGTMGSPAIQSCRTV